MEKQRYKRLKVLSAAIRLDLLNMLQHVGYGHLGGSLSIVELMSVLYGEVLHYDAENPNWQERDMVILSKGHCGPAWYSALANVGFFDKKELYTLNEGGTRLPSHPDRLKTPGVDMTSGSLGQGASVAAGIAMGFRLRHSQQYVYVICGDGELNEGQCWEAFQFIAHYRLHHCIVFIDENKKQLDGFTKDVMNPFSLAQKMEAFGFYVQTIKGNDEEAILKAIEKAKTVEDQAVCIVLDTVKGQGVPYIEALPNNHSVKFDKDEINAACDQVIRDLRAFVEGSEGRV